jgi:hypothetical protein
VICGLTCILNYREIAKIASSHCKTGQFTHSAKINYAAKLFGQVGMAGVTTMIEVGRHRIEAMVPQLMVGRRKSRGGSDRSSMVREYRTFKRMSAADLPLAPDGLGERPLAVLTRRSAGPAGSDRLWQAWYGLQRELAALSRNSRHLVSDSSDHKLNEGDPDQIVAAVIDVIRCARDDAGPGSGGGRLPVEPRDRSE